MLVLVSAIGILIFIPHSTEAAANIDSGAANHWAWNDVIGWIDFRFDANPNVEVQTDELRGYASSSVGYISLNCAYGPPGSNCGVNYKVTNASSGELSGWAWSENIGWISFNCNNSGIGDTCGASDYKVTITNGDFSGWAWNDVVGWISFNCSNQSSCGSVSYKVRTSWGTGPRTANLTSSIFDTADQDGAKLNWVMWQGDLNGGEVKFQIASSNSASGPWDFRGDDGTSASYYGGGAVGPDTQIKLRAADHTNKRYFRYKIFFASNAAGTISPDVRDVIIGYSP